MSSDVPLRSLVLDEVRRPAGEGRCLIVADVAQAHDGSLGDVRPGCALLGHYGGAGSTDRREVKGNDLLSDDDSEPVT